MSSSGVCVSFRQEVLLGIHDFDSDTFKLALYASPANITPQTMTYSTSSEVVGTGYAAGGFALIPTIVNTDTDVLVQLPDISVPNCTFDTDSALLYNVSKGNRAVCAFSFGALQHCENGTFSITWPQPATFTLTG